MDSEPVWGPRSWDLKGSEYHRVEGLGFRGLGVQGLSGLGV